MALLTIAECRALVKTSLTDDQLQAVIDRVEVQISARIGAHQDDTGLVEVTERVKGRGTHIFVRVPFSGIVSITEDGVPVDATSFDGWGESGMLERLPEGSLWGAVCGVTYRPADQRVARKEAAINLVRLYVERTAMTSENIAGEYSFNAPDWDRAIKRELKNLRFQEV